MGTYRFNASRRPNEGAIEGISQQALSSPDGQVGAAVASHSTQWL
jgi:hypothetical protein